MSSIIKLSANGADISLVQLEKSNLELIGKYEDFLCQKIRNAPRFRGCMNKIVASYLVRDRFENKGSSIWIATCEDTIIGSAFGYQVVQKEIAKECNKFDILFTLNNTKLFYLAEILVEEEFRQNDVVIGLIQTLEEGLSPKSKTFFHWTKERDTDEKADFYFLTSISKSDAETEGIFRGLGYKETKYTSTQDRSYKFWIRLQDVQRTSYDMSYGYR
jgi:hypothetical protein